MNSSLGFIAQVLRCSAIHDPDQLAMGGLHVLDWIGIGAAMPHYFAQGSGFVLSADHRHYTFGMIDDRE